jgi:MerR family transcriptional regulator/heat shock protein HspR
MDKFYLQLIRHNTEPENRKGKVNIDDLPFQPVLLERLAAIGFIEIENRMFTAKEVDRVQRLIRIRQSLGVNLAGAVIIIELLEKMEEMHDEIKRSLE